MDRLTAFEKRANFAPLMAWRDLFNRAASAEGGAIKRIAPHLLSHLFYNNYLSPPHYWLL
jgi:hypothetical protein